MMARIQVLLIPCSLNNSRTIVIIQLDFGYEEAEEQGGEAWEMNAIQYHAPPAGWIKV